MAVLVEPHVYQWSRSEYYKMAAAGLFDGKHVELIEGQIIVMSPRGSAHIPAVTLVGEALRAVCGCEYFVRIQGPMDFSEITEPGPDVAVIAGQVRDYAASHPTTAALLVEVADTSVAYDRTTKASLYARAGIAEYWIVHLVARQLEVYRTPRVDATQPYGFAYADVSMHTVSEVVTSLALPHARLAVADLLP